MLTIHTARLRRLSLGVLMLASLGGSSVAATPAAPVSITDIIEARTIDSLSVSPDGRWIAYRVINRSVQADTVQGQWYKAAIDGSGRPIPLGHAFSPLEVMLMSMPQDGVSHWALDSSALYALTEVESAVQVHRLTEKGDTAVTSDEADVQSFALSADGRDLIYQTRNTRQAVAQAQRDEWAHGIHFDQSIITDGLALTDNFRIGARPTTLRRFADQTIGEAQRGEMKTKHVTLPLPASMPDRSKTPARTLPTISHQDLVAGEARLPMGKGMATIVLRQLRKGIVDGPPGQNRIEADLPSGEHVICQADFCRGNPGGIRLITFNDQSREAIILSEPDYISRTAIQAWNPQSGATRVLRPALATLDSGSIYASPCPAIDHYLICVEAGPTRPPRLVRIDIRDGKDLVLADPNEVLAARHFPRTRILSWQDKSGATWNGVLVLPDGPPARNLPLVITSYRCRGFLQGGTAWLTPEFGIAEKGMAALCMNANGNLFGQRDETGSLAPMQPYKMMDDAFKAVIDKLAGEGIVDPSRVGISGHSFSANAASYAISHTQLFRAAVIGSGVTIDPGTYALVAPAANSWRKAVYDVIGMPKPSSDPRHLWEEVSPALNARAISAPILMQTTENEYLFNLQEYAYLQDAHKIVDMYVYPGEGHMASGRPIHQFWRNTRSIDWFARWLSADGGATVTTSP